MMNCATLLRVFGLYYFCAVLVFHVLLLLPQVVVVVTVTAFHLSAVVPIQHARTVTRFSTSIRSTTGSTITDDDDDDDDDDAMTTVVVDVNYYETEPWNTNMKRSNVIQMAQELRNKYGYYLNPLIVPRSQQMEFLDAIIELEGDYLNTNSKLTLSRNDVITMLIGNWDLICTIPIIVPQQQQQQQQTLLEIPSLLENEFIQNLFPTSLPMASFTNKFITITQRIRSIMIDSINDNHNNNNNKIINRVDHVIEIQPPNQINDVLQLLESKNNSNNNNNNDETTTTTTTPSWLRNLNINPFQVKESKVILIHDAEIVNTIDIKEENNNNNDDIDDDIRVKIRLKLQSVVNNIAGTGKNLNPYGADIFSINVPQLDTLLPQNKNQQQKDEWNDALGGSFITTYIDDKYRISRSDLLSLNVGNNNNNNNKDAKNKLQQIRIFQKRPTSVVSGTMVSVEEEEDDDMITDVDDIAIEAPSDVED